MVTSVSLINIYAVCPLALSNGNLNATIDGGVEPMNWVSMLIERMETQGVLDSQLLSDLTAHDHRVVRTLYSLISTSNSDLLKLELKNYGSAIAYEVLRTYLEEMYAYSPLIERADVHQKFGACLHHKKIGEMSELILLRCQTYLDEMTPESQDILGAVISCYIRLRNSKQYRGHLNTLSLKILALVMANSSEPDCGPNDESLVSKKDQVSLLDIWAQFHPALWTDVSKSVTDLTDSQLESDATSCTSSRKSPQTLPLSTYSPTDTDRDTVLSVVSQSTAAGHTPSVQQTTYAGQFCPQGMNVAEVTASKGESNSSTTRQVHFVDDDISVGRNHHRHNSGSEDGFDSESSIPADAAPPLGLRGLSSPHTDGMEHDFASNLTQGRRDVENIRTQIQQIRDNFSREIQWLGAQTAQQGTLSRESSTSSSCTAISISLQDSETKFLGTITEDADFRSFNDDVEIDKLDVQDCPKPRNPQGVPTTGDEKGCMEKDGYGADTISKKGYGFPMPLMVEEYCEEDDCEVKPQSESDVGNVDDYPRVTDAVNVSAALSEADLDVDSNRLAKDALGVKERLAKLSTEFAQASFSGRRSRHMAEYVRHLREQMAAITERNLDMLDRCLASVQESQSEIMDQWEILASQQEHLKEQLNDAIEYQIRLEYENEAIRDLYDEVTEENNIIFERFNEELEKIFEAVNTPNEDVISTSAATTLRHVRGDQGFGEEGWGSTDTIAHECVDSDHPPDSQLRQLLQKAVQDRSLAEQQARRAILQASYFRDLLERHGVEIETTDLFE